MRDVQNTIEMNHHLILTRLAKIKMTRHCQIVVCGVGSIYKLLVVVEAGRVTLENLLFSKVFSSKLNISVIPLPQLLHLWQMSVFPGKVKQFVSWYGQTFVFLATPFLGIYSKEILAHMYEETCPRLFITAW